MERLIGLVPLAGRAERMNGLPKFLMPLPAGSFPLREMVRRMYQAGCETVLIPTSEAMRPFVEYYAGGAGVLIYTVETATMIETVLTAKRWCGGADVLLGLGDTWTNTPPPITRAGQYEVLLHCWPLREGQHRKMGCVEIEAGYCASLRDKPEIPEPATHVWGMMQWRAPFWARIEGRDTHLGTAVVRAMNAGTRVPVASHAGPFWDVGTLDEYKELLGA